MASSLKTFNFKTSDSSDFPNEETVVLSSVISVNICCRGANAVKYEVLSSGDKGEILPGESRSLVCNSEALLDSIKFIFEAPSGIEVFAVVGDSSNGVSTGNEETPSFVEITEAGVQQADKAQSYTMEFNGTGGKVSGVVVPDKFVLSYTATLRNEVLGIEFEVPTEADSNEFKRVLITYLKL
jgi:hypothetical protein